MNSDTFMYVECHMFVQNKSSKKIKSESNNRLDKKHVRCKLQQKKQLLIDWLLTGYKIALYMWVYPMLMPKK